MVVFRSVVVRLAVCGFLFALSSSVFASSHHRHHHPAQASAPVQVALDLTPVVVQPYVVPPVPASPVQASFLRRMNLENGMEVQTTRGIEPKDVKTRNLFILSVTQALEGGFDSVNLYDKGVLSWGIMQWTAGTGSLPPALIYIKRRLLQTGQGRVWHKVFAAQGLDVNAQGLIAYGKPLVTPVDMRLAFRGSAVPGRYDPKVAGYWATVFARAGRQSAIQRFQQEYAERAVDGVLSAPVPGQSVSVRRLCGGDAYAEALVFALWTNNPRHAGEYIGDAALSVRHQTGEADPARWGAGVFREALLSRCRVSRFGSWKQRGALIAARVQALHTAPADALTPYEQLCQAALSDHKTRLVQLASRHKPVPGGGISVHLAAHPPLLSRQHPARRGILRVS